MLKKLTVLILATLLVGVVGCGVQDSPSTQTFVTGQPAKGTDLRLITITSDKMRPWYPSQNVIRPQLEEVVNSGKYNVVSVKTSYSYDHLSSAEVVYDASGQGVGNRIRLRIITSDKPRQSSQSRNEVKLELEEMVNGGKYDVVKIQTTYYPQDYLVVAEVYYRDREKK